VVAVTIMDEEGERGVYTYRKGGIERGRGWRDMRGPNIYKDTKPFTGV
jgi:hypothetical protein